MGQSIVSVLIIGSIQNGKVQKGLERGKSGTNEIDLGGLIL